MITSELILEFDKIKELLCEYTVSDLAKERLKFLKPYLNETECQNHMEETTQARYLLEQGGTPPLSSINDIEKIILLCQKGAMLLPEQLESTAFFLTGCKRMKNYMIKWESKQLNILSYGYSLCDLEQLYKEINQSIQNASVQNNASTELRNIRKKIETIESQIKKKLDELLRSKKNMLSDSYISQRNGRYVMPVKKEYKNAIAGTVVEISQTGNTCFIEPSAVYKLQEQRNQLLLEEDNEVRKILYTLTALVEDAIPELKINIEAMTALDILFSKAKLSIDLKASPVKIDTEHTIKIKQGRHPLLKQEDCVPLDFSIGKNIKGIVITGPNTGGKTVALKTVGLLCIMAQSGLHVPVKEGKFCMNNMILCDIGDGQSISENLSTFSAHIKNMIHILKTANKDSLVLLDELGSGTDPAEGMGIAISILEELRQKNCLFVATTHYPEVKKYSANTEGIINAKMAFDKKTLRPLYRLEIGEAGESCALYIAKELGLPEHILNRAYKATYHGVMAFEMKIPAAPYDSSNTIDIPKIEKTASKKHTPIRQYIYQIGDSVVTPDKTIGIVFQTENEKGEIGVQIKGKKQFINYKRLELKASASELYPPDYDFSILFDTVENRKNRHKMEKKHTPGLIVKIE